MSQVRSVTYVSGMDPLRNLERAMGFEPTTPTLARLFTISIIDKYINALTSLPVGAVPDLCQSRRRKGPQLRCLHRENGHRFPETTALT